MRILRAILVWLLSLIAVMALIGLALGGSFDLTLGKQSRVEAWLDQSGIYNHVVGAAVERAPQTVTVSVDGQSAVIPLDKAAIEQAAQSAFPVSLLKQTTDTFLAANYAWLQGKTAAPSFQANLAPAKSDFAQMVGQYVQHRLAALPACTQAQLAQLSGDVSTLIATCWPPGVNLQSAAAEATQQAATSSEFLASPQLDAASFNLSGTASNNPYYQRFSRLPHAYQAAMRLPWVLGALAIICMIGVIFIARTRRRGWRHIAWMFVAAGVLLELFQLLSNTLFAHVQNRVLAAANTSDTALRTSLLGAIHDTEAAATKVDAWFGVAYLILAGIIFLLLLVIRRRRRQKVNPETAPDVSVADAPPHSPYRQRPAQPKPPRLIQ